MKTGRIFILATLLLGMSACQKNDLPKLPNISLNYFGSNLGYNYVGLTKDTLYLVFSFTDGDADFGNDPNGTKYDIYIKDARFDTGYVGYFFPDIDKSIEDPNKGIAGQCTMIFYAPKLLNARPDSIHANFADTTRFEIYVTDRDGNKSNHIVTDPIYLLP
jgi:hypothetical protein